MADARVASVNVGLPRTLVFQGAAIRTSIHKEPIEGRRAVRRLNLDGDRQADLEVHGGVDKAVYAYPAEHYGHWREFLETTDLPPGSLGENLTVEGLSEEAVHVGDVLRIGTAELVVTQPRTPCYKLAAWFGRPDVVRAFLEGGLTGYYLSVRREGELEAGDVVEIASRDPGRVRIADLNRLQRGERLDADLVRRALEAEALPEWWRRRLGAGRKKP